MEPQPYRRELQLILKTYLSTDNVFTGSKIVKVDNRDAFFLCGCGREFSIRLTSKVKTVGFRCRSCANSKDIDWTGERCAFRRVARDARNRGLSFDITFDFFKNQCHLPCHYCGGTDGNSISVRSKIKDRYIVRDFRYNGLDRKNNNIGYSESNCVPACIVCNRAKREMPYSEFIEWIDRLVGFRNGTEV